MSIGLALDGQAVLGVVLAPEHADCSAEWWGRACGRTATGTGFSTRPPHGSIIAVSDTEYTRELHRYPLPNMQPCGSIALKMARIAAGGADATFTMSPRSEWTSRRAWR